MEKKEAEPLIKPNYALSTPTSSATLQSTLRIFQDATTIF